MSEETKVISLFDLKKDGAMKAGGQGIEMPDPKFTFEETVRRNLENQERMKKERLKANKSLVRNFRLGQKS
jgi:hypothetical protein